jgi:hypothetical protein
MFHNDLQNISHLPKQQFKARKVPQKLIARHLGITYQKVVHLFNGYQPVSNGLEDKLNELLKNTKAGKGVVNE